MSRKKWLLILCVVAMLFLAFVIGLEQVTVQKEEISYAEDYEQLQLYIEYSTTTEEINIWSAEDSYYFFLPSNIEGLDIVFGNLQENDSISIGTDTYSCKDNVLDKIEFDTSYEMQMCVAGNYLEKQQVIFMRSENLPSVFIDTATGTLDEVHSDKNVKEAASLTIIDELGKYEYGGDIEYIKARGNSTFEEVEKKSYQIKLGSKSSLLGMDKAKKWLLMANAKDASLIRNKLVFDYAGQYTEVPSIDGEYADLYVNGDYTGTYFLCEKVEVLEGRLDIADLEKKNEVVNSQTELQNAVQYVSADGKIRALSGLKNPDDITGGYLLEKIRTREYEEARAAFITDAGNYYCVVSPENATVEQVTYICNLFNEMETAVYQQDGRNPDTGKHFSEYLDMDSWTSKYLMEEAFNDPDVPKASVYFYKDSDSVDPLIYSGPMWDYDRTMGAYAVGMYYIDDPLQMGYRAVYANQLLQHEEVMKMVKEKYEEYFLPYVRIEAAGEVAMLQEKLQASAKMNFIRWPEVIGYYEAWDANGEYILEFLEARKTYLSDVWLGGEQYHTVTFLNYSGNVFEKYIVKHGEYLPTVPQTTSYGAIFDGWVSTVTGNPLDIRLPVLEDAVYQSEWIEAELILQNSIDSVETNVNSIDVEGIEALVDEIKRLRKENNARE